MSEVPSNIRDMGGRKTDDGRDFAMGVLLLIAFLFFVWPYLLGTWLAVQFGADNPSTARAVVGWFLEVVWLIFLASIVVGTWVEKNREKTEARRREAEKQRLELEKRQRQRDFGPAGARLFEQAQASVSAIAASEAARTGWLGDPADFDFRADLAAIADNLRRAEEIRTVTAEASSIRHFTKSDTKMLQDARNATSRLEASVQRRVALIAECAQHAGGIDRALRDERERGEMAKRREDLRRRLAPMLYGAQTLPGEPMSDSADVVTARAAAFHELKALIGRHRVEAELILASLICPARSVASCSRAGDTIRHGPHHGAHRSTRTGTGESSTTAA